MMCFLYFLFAISCFVTYISSDESVNNNGITPKGSTEKQQTGPNNRIRSLMFLLCFNFIEPRWRPPYKERLTEGKIIPKDLDPRQQAQLQLPNNIFCAQMEREAAGIFSLLPWWYHYCQDLKERNAKKIKDFYKPMYQSVLENLKWLRRMGLTPPPRVTRKRFFRRL